MMNYGLGVPAGALGILTEHGPWTFNKIFAGNGLDYFVCLPSVKDVIGTDCLS